MNMLGAPKYTVNRNRDKGDQSPGKRTEEAELTQEGAAEFDVTKLINPCETVKENRIERKWSERVQYLVRTMCGSRTSGWSLPGVMSD
jgi:hypothetical protein